MRMVLRMKWRKFRPRCEIPCEFASDCECDGLVHSAVVPGHSEPDIPKIPNLSVKRLPGSPAVWEPELSQTIGNGGGKQGRGNHPPYRRHRPDLEIQHQPQKLHRHAKSSRILHEREAHMEFQYRPHIVDMDTIVDTVFRTPFPRLLDFSLR